MFAFSASRDIAHAISACLYQRLVSYIKIALMAVSKLEPLIIANPSRAIKPGIGIPARSIAIFPSKSSPL